MPIFVDNRGDGEAAVAEWLRKLNYPVTVQHIESGDYVFDEIGIERKTISDLIGSLMSKEKGHSLWSQLSVLKDTYKKPALLVEGFIDWHDRQVSGVLIGVTTGYGMPYYNSLNHQQSAEIIGRIFERYGTAKTSKVPPPAVKRGYTPKQIQWCMLQTIPKIGGVTAARILDEYPHIFTCDQNRNDYNYPCKSFSIQGLNKDAKAMLIKLLCPVKSERE